jgi:hypothetical protein
MKKIIIALTAFLFASHALEAQSFGVSAYGLGYMVKTPDQTVSNYSSTRTLGHTSPFNPGFRVEMNYILPGFNIPISGFNGLGLSYFAPHTDSAVFLAPMANGYYTPTVIGTEKTSQMNIGLRFGYEIPQTFNDFLLIHFGWGMGFNRYKSQYILPEQSSTFNYTSADFDPETFLPRKSGSFGMEVLGGVAYEFERSSLIGQYSFAFGLGGSEEGHGYKHGITAGIYFPLKKL